jgi:NTP pyrophosphatase (non-canonical NTP hydrolase)
MLSDRDIDAIQAEIDGGFRIRPHMVSALVADRAALIAERDEARRERDAATWLSAELRSIGHVIHETKLAKGWTVTTPEKWSDPNQIPADLALLHSEVSEALEAFRKDDQEGFAEELADVLIRLVGLAHGLEIDLGGAAWAKVEKNRSREFKHAGKKL